MSVYMGIKVLLMLQLTAVCVYVRGCNKLIISENKRVQVGKDQEKAQSERDSHSKNRGGKKPN